MFLVWGRFDDMICVIIGFDVFFWSFSGSFRFRGFYFCRRNKFRVC